MKPAKHVFPDAKWTEWHGTIVAMLNLKKVGKEYHGSCPNCGGIDRFWINEYQGTVKLHCRKCDDFRAIADELRRRRLWPSPVDAPKLEQPVDLSDFDDTRLYHERKGVGLHGAKIVENKVLIEIINIEGALVGSQAITPNGEKRFSKGMVKEGAFSIVGGELTNLSGRVYIAEGWSTSASVHEATGRPCVFALDAGNLPKVAASLQRCKPHLDLIVSADHDEKGLEAAKATGLPYAAPRDAGFDWNDVFQRMGAEVVRSALENDFEIVSQSADVLRIPNSVPHEEQSHDALALSLGSESFDLDARYVASWNKWLFWDGTRWVLDEKLNHMTRVRAFLRNRAASLLQEAERQALAFKPAKAEALTQRKRKEASFLRSKLTVVAVENLARSNPSSVANAGSFDNDLMLLGTPAGTVDLHTGELRPARREDMVTKLTSCAPAAAGNRPVLWLKFLEEIFDGDTELISFMQRAAGYALTGRTTEHKLLFLYGSGRNGKSVFINTLTWLWGDYARRAAAETFLNTKSDKHTTGLAGLQGARLVAGSELPVGKTWDESVIKDLTGGDKMTARFMRGDFFDFDPQLTLMIAGNNQPSFRGVDEAIRARVILIPFAVTIPPEKRDGRLADKLKAEGPEILRWAIEGTLQWLDRGLEVPAKVAAASAAYMDDEDTLGQFISDKLFVVRGHFTASDDLYRCFVYWLEEQGLNSWSKQTLIKELKARGFEHAKSNGRRGLKGLKLR